MTYSGKGAAETLEDSFHVAVLLHGDDTTMILLVDPDQEGLVVIMPVK